MAGCFTSERLSLNDLADLAVARAVMPTTCIYFASCYYLLYCIPVVAPRRPKRSEVVTPVIHPDAQLPLPGACCHGKR